VTRVREHQQRFARAPADTTNEVGAFAVIVNDELTDVLAPLRQLRPGVDDETIACRQRLGLRGQRDDRLHACRHQRSVGRRERDGGGHALTACG